MNKTFKLDPRLEQDTLPLAELEFSKLRLMNNSLLPWFILVPKTDQTEVIDLNPTEQQILQQEINLVAAFIRAHFTIDKLNIAAIGNIVKQMHIHIVGRSEGDYCWPGVVWGAPGAEKYPDHAIDQIRQNLQSYIKGATNRV